MIEIYDEFVPGRKNRGLARNKSQFQIVNLNLADHQGQVHLSATRDNVNFYLLILTFPSLY